MGKTLRAAFKTAETGFDPAQVSDVYSNDIIRAIFDPLLTYDWLARPAKLVPNVAVSLPQVNQDATEYTFQIKPGIYFADHPVFKGQKRELVAADFVYSIKRILDPATRSPNLYMFEGKFAGADALIEAARKSGKFDYDAPMAGLQAPQRYTLKIKLNKSDFKLPFLLATVNTGAVAREVVQAYSLQDIMAHPVGTGPYKLKEWVRGAKMVLEANPDYREEIFHATPQAGDAQDAQIMRQMQGKRLPQIGRIEVAVMDESQPRWLAFLAGDLDYTIVPSDFVARVFPGGQLAPELKQAGIIWQKEVAPGTFYSFFNLDDAQFGGYTPERIALRRAIIYAYRLNEEIAHYYSNMAMPAHGPLSPGVLGYDPAWRSARQDLQLARALLERYGYKDRDGDGWREAPDGKPLELVRGSTPSSQDQVLDEVWKRSMDALGIRIRFIKQKWPDLLKMARQGQLPTWGIGWAAQIPDGDTYLQLLYGPNKEANNLARFDLPAFNQRYEKAAGLPHGPARDRLYLEMQQLAVAYGVWHMGVHRVESHLLQPRLLGYKIHPFLTNAWKYMDIDKDIKAQHISQDK
ncbi:ABC transporter substrate-binding protein [Massilia sp. W12]|uniref:ABC transporter substrate-binding protein n=1 Tax=Massilia sp. W12 TaxID=3126507 RepID=UPI0030CD197D